MKPLLKSSSLAFNTSVGHELVELGDLLVEVEMEPRWCYRADAGRFPMAEIVRVLGRGDDFDVGIHFLPSTS